MTETSRLLSLAANRVATGKATYADRNGRAWPDLAAAIASVAPTPHDRARLAEEALARLGAAPPPGADWLTLAAALTRWTLQPADNERPARLRRDEPARIAEKLRSPSRDTRFLQ